MYDLYGFVKKEKKKGASLPLSISRCRELSRNWRIFIKISMLLRKVLSRAWPRKRKRGLDPTSFPFSWFQGVPRGHEKLLRLRFCSVLVTKSASKSGAVPKRLINGQALSAYFNVRILSILDLTAIFISPGVVIFPRVSSQFNGVIDNILRHFLKAPSSLFPRYPGSPGDDPRLLRKQGKINGEFCFLGGKEPFQDTQFNSTFSGRKAAGRLSRCLASLL